MATVAELLVKIGADTSELRKQLNATKRQIRTAFGSDFLKVSNTAAVAIGGIGAALAAAGVKAIEAAGKLQNVQTAFTNMLGSAQKAAAFTKDLQAFAAATPFEFNQVTSAAQKFLAFGFTAEQVIPTLTAVGDAAAGVGLGAEGINRVTLALGQIAAKSKVQSDEMLQLTEAGIPAWQMLADKIGVSVPEAMDMVTKGMVDAQTGISALVTGMSQKFGGMMEQQSKTIQGTWSTMMDGIEQTAGQVGLRLAESLNVTGLFQSIGDGLNNFAQAVQNGGLAQAFKSAIPTEFQVAIVAIGTALVGIAIPAISLAATSVLAFLAPLGAAVAAAAPFIAAATAIASGLFVLWQNGTSAADILDFFGIRLNIVNSFIDTAKSYFSQLGKTIQALLGIAQPVLTAFGVAAYAAFSLVINIIGGVIEKIMVVANVVLTVFNYALSVIEWAANGIGGFLQYIGDCFMNNSNNILPEWATGAMKTISSFVGKAVGWLNNLISKITETNDALAEADGKGKSTTPKAPKKLEIPKYEQFKNPAPKIDKQKAAKTKKDPLLNEAQNTSKQIAEEWYRTFSTKSALVDRWYQEESASLEKTKQLNTNYEVDKQRLAELYAQKRIEALAAEEKEKADIINSARNAAMKTKTAGLSLYGDQGAKELAEMQLDYEKAINSISDRWAEQERNFIGMTESEKSIYLEALKQYGVAFELNAQGQISFAAEAEKEKFAAFKDYQDKRLEYLNQCKDIQANVEKAYANSSYSALKNALRSENMARLSAYNEAQTIMKGYYDAAVEAHESFRTQLADAITESKNSFQTFFTDVLTMQTSFVDGLNSLLNSLFENIVNQITAGWAASITQGALGFLMPGNNGGGSGSNGENSMAAFDSALMSATNSVNSLSIGANGANGVIGTSTGLLGAYNSIQSIVTGTTKPAEGAATTAVTAALTALSAAATAASVALSAISAASGLGFGFFSRGGIVKAASGGSIMGAGTGTSDSIPAMLSNGEYVLTASAVSRLGIPFLDKLNAGDLPGYSSGGPVLSGSYAGNYSGGSGENAGGFMERVINIVMNISTMDADSFRDFLERGGSDVMRQVAYEADRNFAGDTGVW